MDTNMLRVLVLFLLGVGLLMALVILKRGDPLSLRRVVEKTTSGQWLLAVAVVICLVMMTAVNSMAALRKIERPFPNEAIFGLMGAVTTFYCTRSQRNGIHPPEQGSLPGVPPEEP